MPNGAACCLLQICCDPPDRRKKSIDWIVQKTGVWAEDAAKVFDLIDAEVDFAPKGFQAVTDAIVEKTRKHPKADQA